MILITLFLSFLLSLSPAETLQKAQELFDADRYQEALSVLNEQVDGIRSADDRETLSEVLSLMASSYFRLGLFDKALAVQEECYSVDLALGDPELISSSLNNLAAINLATGDLDVAEKMILEAIRYQEQVGQTAALAVRYGMASDILLKQHRPEDAVLIGDRLYTDIACGAAAGIDTILVLSGESTMQTLAESDVKPTYLMQDIRQVLTCLETEVIPHEAQL